MRGNVFVILTIRLRIRRICDLKGAARGQIAGEKEQGSVWRKKMNKPSAPVMRVLAGGQAGRYP
ncbi:hypothetical protein B30_13904 [Celeribacter baekdonensis B30]|uniref:Uncharacterized protein n=1 Tax=Celeribacter baekdonensis B30 TaxID=1208323 RepID=K2IIM3_9RHOB|nr:hypothetical protein B30_13904 [Celeribacter baekdonensis B30]KAB6717817.1 hypothetical protein C8029_01270 [Roseobacter sp. TSBP12]